MKKVAAVAIAGVLLSSLAMPGRGAERWRMDGQSPYSDQRYGMQSQTSYRQAEYIQDRASSPYWQPGNAPGIASSAKRDSYFDRFYPGSAEWLDGRPPPVNYRPLDASRSGSVDYRGYRFRSTGKRGEKLRDERFERDTGFSDGGRRSIVPGASRYQIQGNGEGRSQPSYLGGIELGWYGRGYSFRPLDNQRDGTRTESGIRPVKPTPVRPAWTYGRRSPHGYRSTLEGSDVDAGVRIEDRHPLYDGGRRSLYDNMVDRTAILRSGYGGH